MVLGSVLNEEDELQRVSAGVSSGFFICTEKRSLRGLLKNHERLDFFLQFHDLRLGI
jgi:hypothetical protein